MICDKKLVQEYLLGVVNENYLVRALKWNEGIDGANMRITERVEAPDAEE